MADSTLPYMNAYGKLSQVLKKITTAQEPRSFTNDYLSSILGIRSSSARPAISILKRMGFLKEDRSPTNRYKKYRNTNTRDTALAEGIREAFSELYSRHEYIHNLEKEKIKDIIIEITGLAKSDQKVNSIAGTFCALTDLTDFDKIADNNKADFESAAQEPVLPVTNNLPLKGSSISTDQKVKMALSYTINLNLPETTDAEVYNAIFKSLKENLLQ